MADDSNPFAAPTNLTDVVLIVEDKKIHVSKQYLAVHSPVFEAMFFGGFAEKGKEEIEIKDVVFEEFVDLLKVIYPGHKPISEDSVAYILKLADRLQMKHVVEESESFLRAPNNMRIGQKFLLADRYNFAELRDYYIKFISFDTDFRDDFAGLRERLEYGDLKETTKIAIFERFMSLIYAELQYDWMPGPISLLNSCTFSNPFDAPTERSNIALIVEGKKLHVSKEYLAARYPVFAAMFFEDCAEKGKDEVEITDVVYQEFVDLLNVIHPVYTPITAFSVSHILKLADRYQMKDAIGQCEEFLMNTEEFEMKEKFFMADQYNLLKLMDDCLTSITSEYNIPALKRFPEYSNLSDSTKVAICDRILTVFCPVARDSDFDDSYYGEYSASDLDDWNN